MAAARELSPEVVLLDVQLPDLDGFEVAKRMRLERAPSLIVLVSSRDASSLRRRVAASSAVGFISKADLTGAALTALLAR